MYCKRYRSLATGIVLSAWDLLDIYNRFIDYQWFIKNTGWNNTMYIISAISFICSFVSIVFRPSQHEIFLKRKRRRITNSNDNTYEIICEENEDDNKTSEIIDCNDRERECSSVADSNNVKKDCLGESSLNDILENTERAEPKSEHMTSGYVTMDPGSSTFPEGTKSRDTK